MQKPHLQDTQLPNMAYSNSRVRNNIKMYLLYAIAMSI